ncbi:uncharacterized protein TrAtP1_010909 [Trichoderma atroviride]|uniref:uncharacterized protein n=1 Tax=Hypocrea atroviridis TaxID=63577 RepID=UPI00332A7CAB|nr:hypothetical protein TrAtP1_010909 [Trichoderma atroviride]
MEEAQALYRRVYISYLRMFNQSHPQTLEALDDLAHVSKASNAIDEAETLYKKSLEIKTRVFGAEHPNTADAMHNLAVIDDIRCRYEDAKVKYQKALDIMAASIGKAHPLYITTLENLAFSSRLRANAFGEEDHTRSLISAEGGSSSRTFRDRARRRLTANSMATITPESYAANKSKEEAVLRDASRQRAFAEAEKFYLDALGIKKSAVLLYREEDVVETASKLREMYENEAFYEDCGGEKVSDLMSLLREMRRRGTL